MVDKSETVDEVVFAQTGDLQLPGARALEGLNLQVDARRKRLVAAGPIVSAAAVPPRFGRLVQVPPGAPKTRGKTRTQGPKRPRNTRLKARWAGNAALGFRNTRWPLDIRPWSV